MAKTETAPVAASGVGDTLIFVKLLTALRIFIGISWLSNGLAKVFEKANYDLGFFSGSLIDKKSANDILSGAAHRTGIRPLGAFYENVVLAHWGIWGVLLTIGELAIGLMLIFGIGSRLAALGGVLLIGPVWVMLWHTNQYVWLYPSEDLFPLIVLAIAPAGRYLGYDNRLRQRFGNRWPF